MRAQSTSGGLKVRAVAGSHVVLLGFDLPRSSCRGLLGFGIRRTDHTEGETYWLRGLKTFESTDPDLAPGAARYSTNRHPIQGFTWSDFTAKPGHRYTYRVVAFKGSASDLRPYREVDVTVTTEAEEDGSHDVFFNRGAAASQEYTRRFGSRPPDVADRSDARWAWLSRGAMEAIEAFVARADGPRWGIRVAAYEFRFDRFAEWLRSAHLRGADVRVLYDGNANPPDRSGEVFPRDHNRSTATDERIKSLCDERVTRNDIKRPPISHHKFIVLLRDERPVAVLTGSTNFSYGGVFGQSNLVHVVESDSVAESYLECWNAICRNPDHGELRDRFSEINDIPEHKPRLGTTTILSPQRTLDALEWYGKMAKEAEGALFMTFAFGINKVFLDAYENGAAPLRYALMEKLLAPGVRKEKRPAAEAAMRALRGKVENRFAVGSRISTNRFDRWVKESLSGLNTHVRYIHTKFMLIDPLGDDPIVITGSANFSDASTTKNDENMLVIRRNRRVADIYLGEYMRLWNHYAFREWAARNASEENPRFKFLDESDQWWKQYFGNSARSRQRAYFAGRA